MLKFSNLLIIAMFMGLISFSCTNKENNNNLIETTDIIQKQGITTYQYGTHTNSDYALRSSSVNLDDYVGQSVTVVGQKVEGYPVDGGPDLLEVEKIK